TDVQVRALAHAPSVAFEIVAEVELGNVAVDRASIFLSRVQSEFNFLGRDDIFSKPGIQQPSDREEVAAGANEVRSGKPVVDDPAAGRTLDTLDGDAAMHLGARPLNEVAVEFASPDSVTHRSRVAREYFPAAHPTRAECCNRLQYAAAGRIVFGIDVQRAQHAWRDPAGADFVAWKGRFIEKDHRMAGAPKLPGATGPRRSTAHNHDVRVQHRASHPAFSYPSPSLGRTIAYRLCFLSVG